MEEKTAKIKVININDRYITKTIQFKIDAINRTILEVNYIIAAVNDTFSSPPIVIDLGKGDVCAYLLHYLNTMKCYVEFMELEVFDGLYIQCEGILDNVSSILFEEIDRIDDLGRRLIEFSYITEDINTIDIPLEIMPAFLDTFIQIITDKDIIIEEENNDTESGGNDIDDTVNECADEESKNNGSEHNNSGE